MPVAKHHTTEGWFYQWGEHGKKYFYDPGDPESEAEAKHKAGLQGRAAHAHGFHGK
jgi:hypothetical protein